MFSTAASTLPLPVVVGGEAEVMPTLVVATASTAPVVEDTVELPAIVTDWRSGTGYDDDVDVGSAGTGLQAAVDAGGDVDIAAGGLQRRTGIVRVRADVDVGRGKAGDDRALHRRHADAGGVDRQDRVGVQRQGAGRGGQIGAFSVMPVSTLVNSPVELTSGALIGELVAVCDELSVRLVAVMLAPLSMAELLWIVSP